MNSPYTPKAIAAAIVGVLAPLILVFATFVANEAQTLFDMHLEGAALAVYISSFLLVVLAAVIKLAEHLARILIARAIGDLSKRPAPAPAASEPGGGLHQ